VHDARNGRFLLGVVEGSGEGGVVFCDLPQVPPGPVGKFLVTQMAAVAELEAGLISQRTRAALAAAKARGVRLGNPRLRAGTPEMARVAARTRRRAARAGGRGAALPRAGAPRRRGDAARPRRGAECARRARARGRARVAPAAGQARARGGGDRVAGQRGAVTATSPVLLVRRDPTRAMHRFYAVQVTRDLFGGWALLREWGRVGSPGQMRTMGYPDEAAAAAAMVRLEQRKRRRGTRSRARTELSGATTEPPCNCTAAT
jgi:predicted DNA-binding WGR domain protein